MNRRRRICLTLLSHGLRNDECGYASTAPKNSLSQSSYNVKKGLVLLTTLSSPKITLEAAKEWQ
jgi:hypothetical protein